MGKKIFVSYKYSDTQVQDLNLYEDVDYGWTKIKQKIQTTARHYVDELETILEEEDHIFQGEDDGQDLSAFKDSTIGSKLADKIFNSSVTIVLVSKGMKNVFLPEDDQWITWEISYSLKEQTREDRTSRTNIDIATDIRTKINEYEITKTVQ